MTVNEVVPVSELRSSLAKILKRVAGGISVVIGSYGKPEAVLVSPSTYGRIAPEMVLQHMLGGSVRSTVQFTVEGIRYDRDRGRGTGTEVDLHLGDDFGRVASWLWISDQKDRLWRFLAELLAEYRVHSKEFLALKQEVTFEALLKQMGGPLSVSLDREQIEMLRAEARANVPAHYGDSLFDRIDFGEDTAPKTVSAGVPRAVWTSAMELACRGAASEMLAAIGQIQRPSDHFGRLLVWTAKTLGTASAAELVINVADVIERDFMVDVRKDSQRRKEFLHHATAPSALYPGDDDLSDQIEADAARLL
ncbi:type II toxin-antitoxin system Phd/YefM family antitoxin [Pseudarthrobacter sp. BIM B-2242]|uniref:type II toxin-antitoxin system Phd/YefM family antitoxin n=1 Tax=Pseudarthrobacter sp. BIM B-2242 TaxID=2772401 RepID=UPI00168B63D0|nr:type II toxin-antitoxin system Phd/YefM family antitoxin [Pseudarthrobacter sp. BIM B-2242]QOD05950.1 type II toxin-antitoxin system Phd/YefM family antitoxin [Pseudarthrobacter sp. BIM B-2242]